MHIINCEIAAERNGERKTPQENDRDELDGEPRATLASLALALVLLSVSALWMLDGTFPCQIILFFLSAATSGYAIFFISILEEKYSDIFSTLESIAQTITCMHMLHVFDLLFISMHLSISHCL